MLTPRHSSIRRAFRARLAEGRAAFLVVPGLAAFFLAFFIGSAFVSAAETGLNFPNAGPQQEAAAATSCATPCFTVSKSAAPTTINEGEAVNYTIQVTNLHPTDAITLTNLDDSLATSLGTCGVPQTIIGNENYACSYSLTHSQPGSQENTITATATISTGVSHKQTDTATVIVNDILPDISVSKTAAPTSVPETGGNVIFTFLVTNNSAEAATLNSLTDPFFGGSLHNKGNCALPQPLAASGGSYTCAITQFISGDFSGPAHSNTVTAGASDNDGNSTTANDGATVTFTNVQPNISVSKTAAPTSVPETGGNVTFTFLVTNNSAEAATLNSLTDPFFGGSLHNKGNCALPQPLAASSGSYTCAITKFISGDFSGPAHNNTVTAGANDNDGSSTTADDSAIVTFTDVLPSISVNKTAAPTSVPETGGNVTFTFLVTNNSAEAATLNSLTDPFFGGSLHNKGNCALPQPLAASGGSYTCAITKFISGDFSGPAHNNTVTAGANDNDGSSTTADDSAIVTFTDVLPSISVSKTAAPTSVPETGGNVIFTFLVTNNSAEAATLNSLTDPFFGGSLHNKGNCALPQPLAAGGGSYTCAITQFISGDYGGPNHSNTVTAGAGDNDGNNTTANDGATVSFTDVLPSISVIKTNDADGNGLYSDVEQVPVGVLTATFKVSITNNTQEAITITNILDDQHGAGVALISADESPNCAALVNTPLAGGAAVSCYFDGTIPDSVPSETNTVTVNVKDDENNVGSDGDISTVLVPNVEIAKTPDYQMVLNGGTAVFTITITNTGGVILTNVTITDTQAANCINTFPNLAVGAHESYSCTVNAIKDFTNVAQVTALDSLSGTVTADDAAFVDVINPKIVIVKSPNTQEIPQGAAANFTIQVTNTGDITLTNVIVTDPEATNCNGSLGTLAANQGTSYICSRSNVMEDFLNEATAVGTHPLNATVEDTDTAFVDVNNPDIAIFINPTIQTVVKGGTAQFNVAVINTSNVNLTNVSVDSTVPNCRRTIGSLLAGEDFTYICKKINVQSSFVNLATVIGTNPSNPGKPITDSDVAFVEYLDATVTVAAQPASLPEPGGLVEFVVTVLNQSSIDVTLSQLNSTPYGDVSDLANSNAVNNSCAFNNSSNFNAGNTFVIDPVTVGDNPAFLLGPAEDAHVRSSKPNNNYGDLNHLRLRHGNPEYNSYLKFDVTGLSGVATSAILRLYVTNGSSDGGAVYLVSNNYAGSSAPWLESGLTWNNAPAVSGAALDSVSSVSADQWVEFDVTAAITSNGIYSFGLTNGSSDSVYYSSKEGSHPPELVIASGPPTIVANGGSYVCSFEADVSSQPGNYPVSITAVIDNGALSPNDNTTVTLTDQPSSIALAITPNPVNAFAPSDNVSMNVRVNNTSSADSVTITSLTDDAGSLNGKGTCSLPQTIIPGSFYQCSYVLTVTGSAGESQSYNAMASGKDDDNTNVSNSSQVTININARPTYRLFLPVILNQYVYSEPNDTPCKAFPLALNGQQTFLADDANDWYRFDLSSSGNVVVELTNFLPIDGQLLVYAHDGACTSLTNNHLIAQNGNFSSTKVINLGQRPPGRYYVWLINDGSINITDPYKLRIITP